MNRILARIKTNTDNRDSGPITTAFLLLWYASVQIPILTYFSVLFYNVSFNHQPGDPSLIKLFSFTVLLFSPYITVLFGASPLGAILWIPLGLMTSAFGINYVLNTFPLTSSVRIFVSGLAPVIFLYLYISNFFQLLILGERANPD